MKAYIAGPMFGYEENNHPAFRDAERRLRMMGIEPVSPHRIPPPAHPWGQGCPPGYGSGEHTGPCHMQSDIAALLGCDAAVFIDGWHQSRGATAEFQVALATGKRIGFLLTGRPIFWIQEGEL